MTTMVAVTSVLRTFGPCARGTDLHCRPRAQIASRCNDQDMRWEPDTQNPCDGTIGVDALALMAQRGSLSEIRSDLGTAFVPLPGRDYRAADLSSADLTNVMLKG